MQNLYVSSRQNRQYTIIRDRRIHTITIFFFCGIRLRFWYYKSVLYFLCSKRLKEWVLKCLLDRYNIFSMFFLNTPLKKVTVNQKKDGNVYRNISL